ncbi:ankyrin repeat domain-containing protein [Aeromicrobium stalagmiti]|uniref:ankyrin repeat domain-containing protein n=1 Tax=Aeromicrobium stalagmiti TaxID=2738988 RepID=UPI00156A5D15|nr:ankyrin repeat domain-containing protein [Aeromicrobium stalagmiti]NRQ51696.1 ankyrin repeat domain-containing protein [Aeromicrobium stalagmiti]
MRLLVPLAAVAVLAACSSGDGASPAGSTPSAATTPSPVATTPTNPYADLSASRLSQQLLSAASTGNADKVELLLAAGAELESRDSRDRTPLLLAVTRDRVEAARVLVDAGADPDALDDRHDTPWLVTGVTGSVAMAKVVLEADPDLTIRNRFGGISHIPASERGHADYVAYVLDTTDIAVDHVNDLGWTALLEAVILGQGTEPWQQIVESLVRHGADVSIADRNGITPLQHARRLGFTEIARILERA